MDKKELIRKHAIKVMAKEGYHKTKVQVIAQEANISVGTIYNYFKNKKEILDYIFQVEHDRRVKFLREIQELDISFEKHIELFIKFHFDELEKNSDTIKVLQQEAMSPYLKENKSLHGIKTEFEKIIINAMRKGEIRKVDEKIVSSVIFYFIRGATVAVCDEGDIDIYNRYKEELKKIITSGLR